MQAFTENYGILRGPSTSSTIVIRRLRINISDGIAAAEWPSHKTFIQRTANPLLASIPAPGSDTSGVAKRLFGTMKILNGTIRGKAASQDWIAYYTGEDPA